ncbi:hypothetical protein [Leptospira alexanderi]|uniref:Uncharacterized protein n=1 Tax=Leptospira alexanderi serovar Manhao 3 str. L 60 TaxID=1049759 RepID=V6IA97_9LEPT|nr:hypothetical protein [Leptospira alexanderi]EQA60458.1 hypothetical protein LEP1GSC062_0284 [Leptospira alexanderi serovar Manhao 3 str. L 60]
MFEKEDISGIEFLNAYFKSGKEIENLYQLYVTTILPPGLIPGDLNTELCEDKSKDDELKKELIAVMRVRGAAKLNIIIHKMISGRFSKKKYLNTNLILCLRTSGLEAGAPPTDKF